MDQRRVSTAVTDYSRMIFRHVFDKSCQHMLRFVLDAETTEPVLWDLKSDTGDVDEFETNQLADNRYVMYDSSRRGRCIYLYAKTATKKGNRIVVNLHIDDSFDGDSVGQNPAFNEAHLREINYRRGYVDGAIAAGTSMTNDSRVSTIRSWMEALKDWQTQAIADCSEGDGAVPPPDCVPRMPKKTDSVWDTSDKPVTGGFGDPDGPTV